MSTSPLTALATRIRSIASGRFDTGHPAGRELFAIADELDALAHSGGAELIVQALMAAGFNVRAASPLQHHAECGFWRDRPCDCAIQQLQEAINDRDTR